MSESHSFSERMKRRLLGQSVGWKLPSSDEPFLITTNERHEVSAKVTFAGTLEVGEPLGCDERGAIWPILPAEALSHERQVKIKDYNLPHQDIRTCLLFFDKFDVPLQENGEGGFNWCEPEFRRLGILSPTIWNGTGDMCEMLRNVPFQAFISRDRAEPGRWTMARPTQALGIPRNQLVPKAGIALTLQNALPSFTREVELEDVMEFKRRAWSELIALRTYLDGLVDEAAKNGTNDFEKSDAYRRFKAALHDHIRLMNESNYKKAWRSLKSSCDLPTALGPLGEFAWTGNIDYGTLATGAIVLGVRTVQGLREKRDATNPFEYLTSANLAL